MESLNESDRQKITILQKIGNSKMTGYIGEATSFTTGLDGVPEFRTVHEEDGITITSVGCILKDSILIKQNDSNNIYQLYSWDLNSGKYSLVIFREQRALDYCYTKMRDKNMNLSNGDINENLNTINADMGDISNLFTELDSNKHPLDKMFELDGMIASIKR